jgi:hypothetical protein
MKSTRTRLTPRSIAQLAVWADRWTAIGLSTEPADWHRWELAARQAYSAIGVEFPATVVHVANPFVLALAGALAASLCDGDVDAAQALRDLDDRSVHLAVGEALASIPDVPDRIPRTKQGQGLSAPIAGGLLQALDDARMTEQGLLTVEHDASVFSAGLFQMVAANVGTVDGCIREAITSCVGDLGHWCLWRWQNLVGDWFTIPWGPPQWSFSRDVLGIAPPPDAASWAKALEECAMSAGWWWPHRHFVMVCDRPLEIHTAKRRVRGRDRYVLHRVGAPAILWRDGTELWAVDDVVLTESMVALSRPSHESSVDDAAWLDLFVAQDPRACCSDQCRTKAPHPGQRVPTL